MTKDTRMVVRGGKIYPSGPRHMEGDTRMPQITVSDIKDTLKHQIDTYSDIGSTGYAATNGILLWIECEEAEHSKETDNGQG